MSSPSAPLSIQKYTEKCIVIRGDTKSRINDIKAISGAKFGYYGGEAGWMFPLTREADVRNSLKITSAYVDGPKQIVRTGYPSSSSFQSSSTPQAPVNSNSGGKPVRGSLRGALPRDEEDEEDEKSPSAMPSSFPSSLLSSQTFSAEVQSLRALVETIGNRIQTLQTRVEEFHERLQVYEVHLKSSTNVENNEDSSKNE